MIDEVMFMRHGRTAFNLQRRLQGQIDIPLDIVGQWQVDMSGFTLAQRFYWAKVSNIARHPDRLSQPPIPRFVAATSRNMSKPLRRDAAWWS